MLFKQANLFNPLTHEKLVISEDTKMQEFLESEYVQASSIGYSQNIELLTYVILVHLLSL